MKARFGNWFLRGQMGPRKIGAAELTERRFPPPWIVEELEACFYVCDSAGQKLAFVYFERSWPASRGEAAHQRRGAADCGEHCQAAGAVAQVLSRKRSRIAPSLVQSSRP